MNKEVLIEAKNVNLHIPVYKPSDRTLTVNPFHLISGLYGHKSKRQTRTLLNDITFIINKGERLGVIGGNGAGKTTLLRVLSGVYKPSSGYLYRNGNTQALFNVKVGMRPTATGIENIYLRGLQMGMSISEVSNVVQNVVDFAGIGNHIHDLFGNYSAGMQLRLSVAISTMMNPNILIMDEWIGSGDQKFRQKINHRMGQLIDNSRGLVLATHSIALMKSVCTHGLVLQHGTIVFFGPIDDAIKYYEALNISLN